MSRGSDKGVSGAAQRERAHRTRGVCKSVQQKRRGGTERIVDKIGMGRASSAAWLRGSW